MEKIYLDTIYVAKRRMKGEDFNSACRKRSEERKVTPQNIRLNVCGNLNLRADDWHNFNSRKGKIAGALIKRYPEKRKEILEIFNINR